jgi:hypothetical protein
LQQVASVLQQDIKPGCQILQLPVMAFPEGGQVGQVGNGAHLWLPLILEDYRWTYGAVRGTMAGKFWTMNPPTAKQISSKLNSNEICAVLIDSRGGDADTLSIELLRSQNNSLRLKTIGDYQIATRKNNSP